MKKSKIYLVMFIAFAIVILGVGAYAYVLNSAGVGDVLNASTATAKQATFTAYHDGELTFNISATQMAQMAVSNKAIAEDNASLTVELTGTSDYEATRCTYDVVWVWDSVDVYTQADTTLPLTGASGTIYDYEFSVKLNDGKERDLSEFTWSDDGKEAILIEDQIITSRSNTNKTIQEYEVVVRMYNIETAQRNLFDKAFKGHIEMKNYTCETDLTENVAESTQTMAYYLYNESSGNYESTTLAALDDITKTYGTVDEKLSHCEKSGKVNSELVSNIENDTCNVYLKVSRTSTIAPGSNLAMAIEEQGELNSLSADNSWGIINENGYRYEGSDYATPTGGNATSVITCSAWNSCTFTGDSKSGTYTSYRAAAEEAVAQGILKDSSMSNYVCFDSACTDGRYRIIGAFNETYDADGDGTAETTGYLTKIIRNELIENTDGSVLQMAFEATSDAGTEYNDWISSDMRSYLHNTYGPGTTYAKSFTIGATYHLGNVTWNADANTQYAAERTSLVHTNNQASDVATYGLIYPSDYGYSVLSSDCARTTNTGHTNVVVGTGYYVTACSQENWMYSSGMYGQVNFWWTMSPHASRVTDVFTISDHGDITYADASLGTGAIRPSWYLKPETKVVSGLGTFDSPYILGL